MALNSKGQEIIDETLPAMPAGFKRPETLAEQVQRMVRTTVSQEAVNAGRESFEDSEDFDVDDEIDPTSQYETHFDPVLGQEISAEEFKRSQGVYKSRYLQAQQEYYASLDAEKQRNSTPAKQPKAAPKPAPKPDETSLQKPLDSGT